MFSRSPKNIFSRVILNFAPSRLPKITFFVVVLSFVDTYAQAEIRWSADGNWLAYRQATRTDTAAKLKPGWLFEPERFLQPIEPGQDLHHRIWIGRADLKAWHRIAESPLFLSDPAWAANGRSIFYAAAEPGPTSKTHWRVRQVSSLDAPLKNSYVVWEKELPTGWTPPPAGSRERFLLGELQLGPDGLMILTDPVNYELMLVRAESREVLTRFPGGHSARIHPNSQWVAWLRTESWPARSAELVLTSLPSGAHSTHVKNVLPDAAPIFSSDGQALYIARHQKPPGALNVPDGSDWPELSRVDLKQPRTTRFSPLVGTPVLPSERFAGLSFTINAEEVLLLYAPVIRPRPTEIVWFQPKTAATFKRFPPLDLNTPVHSLALSADDSLALRLGQESTPLDSSGLPGALCDLLTEQIYPFIPDQYARQAWVWMLARCAAQILYKELPVSPATNDKSRKIRFSLIPTLDELPGDGPATLRLRRVATVGLRSLGLDPAKISEQAIENLADWELEAASLFLVLTNHHPEAARALTLIPTQGMNPTTLGRLMAIRAQEEISLGQGAEAGMILDALKRSEPFVAGEIEPNGQGGYKLRPIPPSDWNLFIKNLHQLAENPPRSAEGRTPENPLGHFNPDDPANDPDLKIQAPKPILP